MAASPTRAACSKLLSQGDGRVPVAVGVTGSQGVPCLCRAR